MLLALFGFTLSVLRVLAITQLFETPLAARELLALLLLLMVAGVLMGAFRPRRAGGRVLSSPWPCS